MEDRRRGSGFSIAVPRGDKAMSNAYPIYPQVSPYFIQSPSYPLLMNPPPMPTYHYGVPPTPFLMGSGGFPAMDSYGGPPSIRRAGSINAKIMSQDARRPFAGAARRSEHAEAADGHEYSYFGANEATDAGFDHGTIEDGEEQQRSVLERMKKDHETKQQTFWDKMKFWQTTKPNEEDIDQQLRSAEATLQRSYNVRKQTPTAGGGAGAGQAPYPGIIIEEMLESASMHEAEVEAIRNAESASVLGRDQFTAVIPQRAPVRWKHTTPLNTVVMFVPQQEAWVVERMGKFNRILEPGLNVLVPLLDKVKYVQSLKEIAIDIPQQSAITIDNVTLNIDGVLYLRVTDPYKASYGVEDPEFAITQLAQTTMRSEIGRITMDTLFRDRENLNIGIVNNINMASDAWGISCMRYEVRDIRMPARVQEAMQMQVEAERKKRAAILESEGIKLAEINVAEGKKQARILQSEAEKTELINSAQGSAEAVVAAGKARAQSIEIVAKALEEPNGHNAAALAVAEKYVSAFQELARTNNTLILPANTGDVSSMVAQAMTVYSQLVKPSTMSREDDAVTDATAETVMIEDASSVAGKSSAKSKK